MGNFLLSGSEEKAVFVIDGRPSKQFQPLGYVSKHQIITSLIITHT